MSTNNDHIFNGFDNDYSYNYDDDYYGVDSNSDSDEGILILLIFGAFLVTFGCCYYKASQNSSSQNNNRNDSHVRDLRQIRQRLSERGNRPRVGVTSSNNTTDDSIAVDRKELIKKNLFTRVIQREESARELCEVLSISRGVNQKRLEYDREGEGFDGQTSGTSCAKRFCVRSFYECSNLKRLKYRTESEMMIYNNKDDEDDEEIISSPTCHKSS